MGGELAGAEFFVAPEDVALGALAFGEEAVGEADGLDGFAVEDGADADAGLGGEVGEQRVGIGHVLGDVGDDLGCGEGALECCEGGEQQTCEQGNREQHESPGPDAAAGVEGVAEPALPNLGPWFGSRLRLRLRRAHGCRREGYAEVSTATEAGPDGRGRARAFGVRCLPAALFVRGFSDAKRR
ncbi:MAG: hypothetical protein M5U12_15670 [Verrucomicrobia bacterium]|nr:hypothetical protein [Verrucomicrobiota bacterium]